MFIDSCLYNDFHKYIDIITINKNNFFIKDLETVKYLHCLYCCKIPNICIHDYIDKILQSIYREDSNIDGLIITAIVLIKRLLTFLTVNNYNVHRLIAGILMISQKIYDDIYYSNKSWSIICGLRLDDINRIEVDILKILNFNTFIKHAEMLTIIKSIKYLQ